VTIHSIQDIIRQLRDAGIGILLTDHRERETLSITDRSYIICAGQVLVSGDAETVLNDEEAQRLYFGKRFDKESIIAGREAMPAIAPLELTGAERQIAQLQSLLEQQIDKPVEKSQASAAAARHSTLRVYSNQAPREDVA
jgi:ABC-type multidrug transport system ATPase subunit